MTAVLNGADDWCSLRFFEGGQVAHLVPFGDERALCRRQPLWGEDWLGGGSWDESQTAEALPLCSRCEEVGSRYDGR